MIIDTLNSKWILKTVTKIHRFVVFGCIMHFMYHLADDMWIGTGKCMLHKIYKCKYQSQAWAWSSHSFTYKSVWEDYIFNK